MDVAILHKYWIYIYDNKTEEKKKRKKEKLQQIFKWFRNCFRI